MSRNRSNFVRIMGTASAVVLSSTLAMPAVAIAADIDDGAEIVAQSETRAEEKAQKVVALIDALPTKVSIDDTDTMKKVDEANKAYTDFMDEFSEELTEAGAKKLITNLEKLEDINKSIAEQTAAKEKADAEKQAAVDDANTKIAGLANGGDIEDLMLADEADVKAAREALDKVDKLEFKWKSSVSEATRGRLKDAENKIVALQAAADKALNKASDAVEKALKDLDLDTIAAKKDKKAIQAAKDAQKALDDVKASKEYKAVTEDMTSRIDAANEAIADKKDAVEEAENAVKRIKQFIEGLKEEAAKAEDENEKKNIETYIKHLEIELGVAEDNLAKAQAELDKAEAIKDGLTEAEKRFDANEQLIDDVQKAIDNNPADNVIKAINDLKEKMDSEEGLTLDDAADVAAARAAYNNLSEEQKDAVEKGTDLDTIKEAEKKIKELEEADGKADEKAAKKVDDAIAALPAELTLNDADAVKAARDAYNELTDAQKAKVTKLADLEAAEAKIAELKAAEEKAAADAAAVKEFTDLIASLPAVQHLDNLTLADEADVVAARAAYDKLTDDQKAIDPVPAIAAQIEKAEAKIEELKKADETTDMFRVYNPNSGEHLFTVDAAEKDNLVSLGWSFEGVAWSAPTSSDAPVYRVYNPNAGEHLYTKDAAEVANLVKAGWQDEGVKFYSASEDEGAAIYRVYNPNEFANNHHFTADAAEKDNLVSLGWKYEDVAWYGVAAEV